MKHRQDFIEREVNDMSFKPSKGIVNKAEGQATRHLDDNTEVENDAMARAKQNIEISRGILEGKLKANVYRGQSGYMNYFDQTEEGLK